MTDNRARALREAREAVTRGLEDPWAKGGPSNDTVEYTVRLVADAILDAERRGREMVVDKAIETIRAYEPSKNDDGMNEMQGAVFRAGEEHAMLVRACNILRALRTPVPGNGEGTGHE